MSSQGVHDMRAGEKIIRESKSADLIGDWAPGSTVGIIRETRLHRSKKSQKSGLKGLMCCVAPTPAAYD